MWASHRRWDGAGPGAPSAAGHQGTHGISHAVGEAGDHGTKANRAGFLGHAGTRLLRDPCSCVRAVPA